MFRNQLLVPYERNYTYKYAKLKLLMPYYFLFFYSLYSNRQIKLATIQTPVVLAAFV